MQLAARDEHQGLVAERPRLGWGRHVMNAQRHRRDSALGVAFNVVPAQHQIPHGDRCAAQFARAHELADPPGRQPEEVRRLLSTEHWEPTRPLPTPIERERERGPRRTGHHLPLPAPRERDPRGEQTRVETTGVPCDHERVGAALRVPQHPGSQLLEEPSVLAVIDERHSPGSTLAAALLCQVVQACPPPQERPRSRREVHGGHAGVHGAAAEGAHQQGLPRPLGAGDQNVPPAQIQLDGVTLLVPPLHLRTDVDQVWHRSTPITPRTCTSSKRAESFAAAIRTGRTWDQRVFQVVPSCRARP